MAKQVLFEEKIRAVREYLKEGRGRFLAIIDSRRYSIRIMSTGAASGCANRF